MVTMLIICDRFIAVDILGRQRRPEVDNVIDSVGARGGVRRTAVARRPGRALADRAVDTLCEQSPAYRRKRPAPAGGTGGTGSSNPASPCSESANSRSLGSATCTTCIGPCGLLGSGRHILRSALVAGFCAVNSKGKTVEISNRGRSE
jgi:hypothetical protein